MNITELIEKLKRLDPKLKVHVETFDRDYGAEITPLRDITIFQHYDIEAEKFVDGIKFK